MWVYDIALFSAVLPREFNFIIRILLSAVYGVGYCILFPIMAFLVPILNVWFMYIIIVREGISVYTALMVIPGIMRTIYLVFVIIADLVGKFLTKNTKRATSCSKEEIK